MNKLTKQINKQLADMSSITELFSDADDAFVERIMTNSAWEHELQPFLPEKFDLSYITSEKRTHLILLGETF